jgi:hypothetical protein
MDTSRVGPGEWIAAIGGLVLLIALFFLDWYSLEPDIAPVEIGASFLAQVQPPTEIPGLEIPTLDIGAWDGQGFLGTIANLIMIAAGVWAIVAVALKAGAGNGEAPGDPSRTTMALGIAATVMVLLRIIFTPGEEGLDTSLKFGIFVALIGAVLTALGGLMSRGAGRTPAPRVRATEPPPPPPSEPPPPPPPSEPPPPPPPSEPPPAR